MFPLLTEPDDLELLVVFLLVDEFLPHQDLASHEFFAEEYFARLAVDILAFFLDGLEHSFDLKFLLLDAEDVAVELLLVAEEVLGDSVLDVLESQVLSVLGLQLVDAQHVLYFFFRVVFILLSLHLEVILSLLLGLQSFFLDLRLVLDF